MAFRVLLGKGVNEQDLKDITAKSERKIKTIFDKQTGQATADTVRIKSYTTCLSVDLVHKLKLHSIIGDRLTTHDERLDGSNMIFNRTRILMYPKDGFVKKHADNNQRNNYLFRLIFIPPKSYVDWDGGVLICTNPCPYSPPNEFQQDENNWSVVYLPFGIPHEVTPVTKGERFVVVTDITINGIKNGSFDFKMESEEDDIGPGGDFDYF